MCDASMAMCDGSMGHRRLAPWAMCDGSMGHVRRLHGPQAPCTTTLSSLDAAVVTRRRRRETSFAFPSGGARQRARLYTSGPLCDDGGLGASTQTAPTSLTRDCAVCGPRVRACRGGRPRYRSAPRTALQRTRTPRTAIATVAALAQSTWVDSAVRSRFPPIGAHLRRDVQMGIRGPTLIATTAAPARSSNRLIAPTAPTARTAARA